MPPRIEEEDVTTMAPPSSPCSSRTDGTGVVWKEVSTVPSWCHLLYSKEDENSDPAATTTTKEKLQRALQVASQQHVQLLNTAQCELIKLHVSTKRRTPLLDACLASLQDTACTFIEHASRLVTTMDTTPTSTTTSAAAAAGPYKSAGSMASFKMMGQIQASLSVMRVLRYLDSIQNALLLLTDREQLDSKLQWLLDQVVVEDTHDDNNQESNNKLLPSSTFRISSWMQSPRLALDLIVGKSATWSHPHHDDEDGAPALSIRVDPVWQVHVEDLLMNCHHDDDDDDHQDDSKMTAVPVLPFTTNCALTIIKVAYTPTSNSGETKSTTGRTGQALVRVRVSPLLPAPSSANKKKKKTPVWGHDHEVLRKIRVQEARVIQLNADPPIPKSNVDLYESSVYGTSDVTVTLLMPTYSTQQLNETPNVHIELIVAFDE